MDDNKVVHTRAGSLSAKAAGQIIDELSESLDQQHVLEAIERNLRMANAFSYMELQEKTRLPCGEIDPDIQDVMKRLITNFWQA